MSAIVTIQSIDIIANSRADINTNFSNLNADKAEKTLTVNGKALSTNPTLGLASSDFANQGTATTVLHGNASGNPAFSAVVEADQTLADNTTANVSSTAHGYAPKSAADATKFLNSAATPAYAQVKDSDLATTDVTSNNVSTSKHGFAPKGDGSTTKFLNANGAYSTPGGLIPKGVVTTHDLSTTGAQTIAHGVGQTPKFIVVTVFGPGITGAQQSVGTYDGTTTSGIFQNASAGFINDTGTSSSNIAHIKVSNGNDSSAVPTMDATNVTLTWSNNGSPTGTAQILVQAYA